MPPCRHSPHARVRPTSTIRTTAPSLPTTVSHTEPCTFAPDAYPVDSPIVVQPGARVRFALVWNWRRGTGPARMFGVTLDPELPDGSAITLPPIRYRRLCDPAGTRVVLAVSPFFPQSGG